MRLPTRVTLPFGYVVRVKQVTDAEMQAEDGSDQGDDPCDGLWDADTRTIFIRRALPLKRKKYILIHETGHALLDFQHAMFDEGAARP